MKLLEKLRKLLPEKTLWKRMEEVFDKETVKELKKAKLLKEFADKTGIPVEIKIPQLGMHYVYDPLDRKVKEKKIKLIEELIKSIIDNLKKKEILRKLDIWE